MFFNIASIIEAKQPKAFFLENVRHFLKHDDGKTYITAKRILKDLGYSFHAKVVKASDHGLPQLRPRLFMVSFKDRHDFEFPEATQPTMTMSDIFGGQCHRDIDYTLRVGGRSSGLHDRRNWDTYLVDGEVKRLGPFEGAKMQGFPESFEFPVSETQAMKQLGNSVAVPAIKATAEQIINAIKGQYGNSKGI